MHIFINVSNNSNKVFRGKTLKTLLKVVESSEKHRIAFFCERNTVTTPNDFHKIIFHKVFITEKKHHF